MTKGKRENCKAENTKCKTAVGGGRYNGEKRKLMEDKNRTCSSSEGLHSLVESGCVKVLPLSASLQTICASEPFMEEWHPFRTE